MSIDALLPPLPHTVLRSRDDLLALYESAPEREWFARQWAAAVAGHEHWSLPGHCSACDAPRSFGGVTPAGSSPDEPLIPNYREMLHCPSCELNNRQRLAAAAVRTALARSEGPKVIYLHEQITAMYRWVTTTFGEGNEVIGSEYLGPEHAPGAIVDGIRHEDALGLSFADESVDLTLSTDVLEHVPDIGPALREAARVTKPGGAFIFSIPFHDTAETTFKRAELQADGSLVHHRPPEYHGNPTLPDEGSLVFYDYGWDLLDQLRDAGFEDAVAIGAWSIPHGIVGGRYQLLFLAVKAGADSEAGEATAVGSLAVPGDAQQQQSPEAIVSSAFERVLGRGVRDGELADWTARLAATDEAGLIAQLLDTDEHRAAVEQPRFVPPGHFYSPIPSPAEIAEHAQFDWGVESLPGIDLRADEQRALLERFAKGYPDLPFEEERVEGLRYHYGNPNYGHSDAIFLVSMIRELQPKRFIEVGSGDSSCALLDANDRYLDGKLEVTFIEPYPAYLQSLLGEQEAAGIRLLESRLQDVDLAEYERLESGDILFIDSTHVSKVGSDVNHLVFEILPRLKPGVHVHIHDIFWPFEYPNGWLAEGRAWNENYLLRAFLEFNPDYEIVLFGHWAVTRNADWFREHMPRCLNNAGGSIWLRRTAA